MATTESHLKEGGTNKEPPPSIVTKQSSPSDEDKVHIRQARTPKHANTKAVDGGDLNKGVDAARALSYPMQDYPPSSLAVPPPQQQQYGGGHPGGGSGGYHYPPLV